MKIIRYGDKKRVEMKNNMEILVLMSLIHDKKTLLSLIATK